MAEPDAEEQRWLQLMAAAQDGDRAAYDRLLHEILPFVVALVRPQHRTPDCVEEMVQDVLLTVHRVRHTYDPSRPFKPWLSAIANRRSVELLRRRRPSPLKTSDDRGL